MIASFGLTKWRDGEVMRKNVDGSRDDIGVVISILRLDQKSSDPKFCSMVLIRRDSHHL
jgi:hypothetical protein